MSDNKHNQLPDISQIRNYPHNRPHIGLHLIRSNLYVEERVSARKTVNGKEKTYSKAVTIGKVVDLVYYPIEEYRKLFLRNGKPRDVAALKGSVRSYVRHKPASEVKKRRLPKYAEGLPDKNTIEDFPHEIEGARIIKKVRHIKDQDNNVIETKTVYYVVTSTYFRSDGENRHIDQIHGRIVGNRFYTLEAYRKLFDRNGNPRAPEAATDKSKNKR